MEQPSRRPGSLWRWQGHWQSSLEGWEPSRTVLGSQGDAQSGITMAGGNNPLCACSAPHFPKDFLPTLVMGHQWCTVFLGSTKESTVNIGGKPSMHAACSSSPGFFSLASLCDSVTLLDHQARRTVAK